jgi:hypothetical protein
MKTIDLIKSFNKQIISFINHQQNKPIYDHYFTHLPVLAAMVQKTEGPILELGCGFYSTFVISEMIKNTRLFISIDDCNEWINYFKLLQSDNHKFIAIQNKDWFKTIYQIPKINWDIVFIDSADNDINGKFLRARLIEYFKDKSNYIIIHDTEPEFDQTHGWRTIINQFKYKYNYSIIKPNTLVLSNYFEIPIK